MGRGGAAAAAAVSLLLAASVGVVAATDLSVYLAPVTSDWIEQEPASNVLDGPFTAHTYARYINNSATEFALDLEGFVAGYAREWVQNDTEDLLVERVFQFDSSDGAGSAFNSFTRGQRTDQYFKRELDALPQVQSFGCEMDYQDTVSYRFYFVRANLFFVVHLQTSSGKDLSSPARDVAQTEYDTAPSGGVPAPSRTFGVSGGVAAAVGAAAVGLAILIAAVVLIVVRTTRPRPVFAPMLHISPDGAYWWDGMGWHDSRVEIPPNAQRSPDGSYWWDGRTWRLVNQPQ